MVGKYTKISGLIGDKPEQNKRREKFSRGSADVENVLWICLPNELFPLETSHQKLAQLA